MTDTAPDITVYWRPGCPFCSKLSRQLDRAGLEATWVDIWDDPTAARYVRSVAGGNETVPTVVVGGRAMVNPSVDQVAAASGQQPATSAGSRRGGHSGKRSLRRFFTGGGA